jgi:multiple antibiotic resistance protein
MEDVSFTPMAVTIVSGSGAIGVAIGMSEQTTAWMGIVEYLLGIVLFEIILYLLLVKILGKNGLGTINRILGFFVLAIAV